MCRWAAYIGEEVFLEDIVTAPCHSLIAQSHGALEAKTPTNGDGFGARLVWRATRTRPLPRHPARLVGPEPEEPVPADPSPLFLAHVRASTGGATSRNNCHPFVVGPLELHA